MAEPTYIRDVSLRDGLQMVQSEVPTATKLEWLNGLVAAGLRRVEVTSFVPPAVIPQFADAPEVAAEALKLQGVSVSALVVNLKGALRAFDAGFRNVSYVVSASEAHSAANARRSTDAALDEFRRIVAERDRRKSATPIMLECGIATAFGCSIQGEVGEARVLEIAERVVADGADSVDVRRYGRICQPRFGKPTVCPASQSPRSCHRRCAFSRHPRTWPRQCDGCVGRRHQPFRCLGCRASVVTLTLVSPGRLFRGFRLPTWSR